MKVKMDGEYRDVSFWSFFKGYHLSWGLITIIMWAIFLFIGVFIA